MTQQGSQDPETAAAETQFSETIRLDRPRVAGVHRALDVTSTFSLEIDLKHPLIRDAIDSVVGADALKGSPCFWTKCSRGLGQRINPVHTPCLPRFALDSSPNGAPRLSRGLFATSGKVTTMTRPGSPFQALKQ